MAKNLVRFNVAGRDPLNLFVVKPSGSFTIPTSKTVASAVDPSVGGSLLGSVVDVEGGQILLGVNDGGSGTANALDFTMQGDCDLYPGDVVACSAVASNVVTVTVTSVDGTVRTFLITGVTTYGGVVGYYA